MTLKKSFDRLRWRFTPDKDGVFMTMTPNKKDIDAFNKILELLQFEQNKTIQENILFAKLYTFLLGEFTKHYTDIDFANKEINKLLSESMSVRIFELTEQLKDMEYRNYFNRKEILDPFLKTKTLKELEEIHERYADKLPQLDPIEFLKCGNNWDIKNVEYQLENAINLSIQNFKNHV